jgi:hypothetical protein
MHSHMGTNLYGIPANVGVFVVMRGQSGTASARVRFAGAVFYKATAPERKVTRLFSARQF